MNLPAFLALAVCFVIVMSKMLITLKLRISRRILEVEQDQYRVAKKELHQAQNKGKLLRANQKQLEVQKKSLSGVLARLEKELEELRCRKTQKEAVDEHQLKLAERLRRQVG